MKQVPDPADRYELENYWLDHWDAHRIRLLIDEAAAWGADEQRAADLQRIRRLSRVHGSGIAA